jgi:hypothetical protein
LDQEERQERRSEPVLQAELSPLKSPGARSPGRSDLVRQERYPHAS